MSQAPDPLSAARRMAEWNAQAPTEPGWYYSLDPVSEPDEPGSAIERCIDFAEKEAYIPLATTEEARADLRALRDVAEAAEEVRRAFAVGDLQPQLDALAKNARALARLRERGA